MAPVLDRAVERAPTAALCLDLLVKTLVGAIVLLHLLPEGWAQARAAAPVAMVAGWAFPLLFERLPSAAGVRDGVALVFAGVGLVAHSLVDGTGLVAHDHGNEWLPVAVILHTLPVGVIAWRGYRPYVGPAGAAAVLAVAGLATVVGFVGGSTLVDESTESWLIVFQCLVGGTLLHLLSHHEGMPASGAKGHAHDHTHGHTGDR